MLRLIWSHPEFRTKEDIRDAREPLESNPLTLIYSLHRQNTRPVLG